MATILPALLLLTFSFASINAYKVVCYYTAWAQYRYGPAMFTPENIDPKLCTHIVYAFAKLDGNRLAPYEWNDDNTAFSKGMYYKVTGLKKNNPNLKVLLAVGGWEMGSAPFTKMVATEASRKEFCSSSVLFLEKRGFDGLELHWQYPEKRGSLPGDREKFTLLIQECKNVFAGTLLLSAAVLPDGIKAGGSYEVAKIAKELDFISLLTYDMRAMWDTQTSHHAPLHSFPQDQTKYQLVNAANSVDWWLSNGAPANKLVLGLPAYARTFTVNAATPVIGLPVQNYGAVGQWTREESFMAYYEVCNEINQANSVTKHYSSQGNVAITSKGNQWFGYDDEVTMKTMTDYVKQKNLAGAMLYSLDLDDFNGKFCKKGPFPLLTAIFNGLSNEVNTTTNLDNFIPLENTKSTDDSTKPTPTPATTEDNSLLSADACFKTGETKAFPGNCSKYFVCQDGSFVMHQCPGDLRFNTDREFCDIPENVSC